MAMDCDHFNCRDYHISPHFAAVAITERSPLYRHESFDELQQRCRSPASQRPKFPLLRLPLELRQQILNYLLPCTQPFRGSGLRLLRSQTFGQKNAKMRESGHSVIWQRGNTSVFCVCKQLHDECAELLYGTNAFLLIVSYTGITFQFRWLLRSGLAPSRSHPFLKLLPERYMKLIRRVLVTVELVDSYTGMIKYNMTGSKGLTHGLTRQVQRLVCALEGSGGTQNDERQRLARMQIQVTDRNSALDVKRFRASETGSQDAKDVEQILLPFGTLWGIEFASVSGSVADEFATSLADQMMSQKCPERLPHKTLGEDIEKSITGPARLCVYGNDI